MSPPPQIPRLVTADTLACLQEVRRPEHNIEVCRKCEDTGVSSTIICPRLQGQKEKMMKFFFRVPVQEKRKDKQERRKEKKETTMRKKRQERRNKKQEKRQEEQETRQEKERRTRKEKEEEKQGRRKQEECRKRKEK